MPWHLVLPLLGGLVYVLGALLLKRAAELGGGVWRTARLCNYVSTALFLPLYALGGTVRWDLWWQPAVLALLFVAGQVLTLLALNVGDVSIATPVMGVKIPLVGVLTTLLLGERLGLGLWAAMALSSMAIALLHVSKGEAHHHVGRTIMLAAFAASAYALFDVFVQKWSPGWGTGRLLPMMMVFVTLYSFGLRSRQRSGESGKPVPRNARGWLVAGAFCFALQGLLIVSAVSLYGQATVANVLYSSRGLWSVVAVWLVGHWFRNDERAQGSRVMGWRFLGAALLMAAIVIVLVGSDQR